MRATYIHGVRDVRLGDKADPDRQAEAVLIRVSGVGVCGSDLHYYLEGGIGSACIHEPFVPGHEMAGWIVDDRPDLGLKKGQLVAVEPAKPCGHCEWCERGEINLCPNVEFLGAPPYHGAMTETIAVRPSQVFPVPEGFSVAEAVMLEPLGVGIQTMDLAKQRVFETVAVIGCGPIGLCLTQLARLQGADRVYAIDPVDYRREAAGRLGADDIADSHERIAQWTDGRGVDLVLEATNSPHGFQHAAEAVRIGGRLILAGFPEGNQYTLDASLARRKGLVIKFVRRMGHVYPRAIKMVAEKRVDMEAIVTHRFTLEESNRAFELQSACQDGALKSIIVPNAERE
ncbi:MAG TPA: alcohol dehydrogenase catalytic domain-containing protein [Gammaproteobacteria bacterium]|nr:alcohol dehydrogenase catalytic domain-containing protein [Gammaproteobacteria bacterium]